MPKEFSVKELKIENGKVVHFVVESETDAESFKVFVGYATDLALVPEKGHRLTTKLVGKLRRLIAECNKAASKGIKLQA